MLTSVGRAAVRRVLVSRAPSRIVSQHAAPSLALLVRWAPAASVRGFGVSRWVRMPEATKKGTTKKKASSKSTATKKTKKAVAKKPKKTVKVGRQKKKLTPEEKDNAERRLLQKIALLKRPTNLPNSTYQVYTSQQFTKGGEPFGEQVKTITSNFKFLSAAELEKLQSVAKANSEANKEIQAQWIQSHPPEAIYIANIARSRLNRKYNKTLRKLRDDRLPQRGISGYVRFLQERIPQAGGDSAKESFRAVAQEWSSLSDSTKRSYQQSAAQDAQRSKEQLQEMKKKGKAYWEAQGVTGIKI